MITHENLEKFLSMTPGKKVLAVVVVNLVLIGMVLSFAVTLYRIGEKNGKNQINQQIKLELEDSQIREQMLRDSAEKLAGQNDLLKMQTEAQAEILDAAKDKQAREQAENLNKISVRHQQKIEEINSEEDLRTATRAMCAEYKAEGYKLSDKLCPNN